VEEVEVIDVTLEGFLIRPQIFRTPYFRERFEDQARRNLALAIQCLGGENDG